MHSTFFAGFVLLYSCFCPGHGLAFYHWVHVSLCIKNIINVHIHSSKAVDHYTILLLTAQEQISADCWMKRTGKKNMFTISICAES